MTESLKDLISADLDKSELKSGKDDSFKLPLRRHGFDDEKEFVKFVKNVEKLVRNSIEYREWVNYITEVVGYANCALTEERMTEVTIEIHHHPINLFTITKAVLTHKINTQKDFCTFDIAQDIIDLHFQNRIGYIPLVSTLHEKYHTGFLEIPIDFCHGDYYYILNNYTFDEDDADRVRQLCLVKSSDMRVKWGRNQYPALEK
jgi:hypothetical protein